MAFKTARSLGLIVDESTCADGYAYLILHVRYVDEAGSVNVEQAGTIRLSLDQERARQFANQLLPDDETLDDNYEIKLKGESSLLLP